MLIIILYNFQGMPPGSVYNPIEPYLKINLAPLKDVKLTVIAERVRSKAYHDMEFFLSLDLAKRMQRRAQELQASST